MDITSFIILGCVAFSVVLYHSVPKIREWIDNEEC